MKKDFPYIYSLADGTQVEADRLDDGKSFSFHLDKPTGQTDSFTWAPESDGGKESLPDPPHAEAIRLFLEAHKDLQQ